MPIKFLVGNNVNMRTKCVIDFTDKKTKFNATDIYLKVGAASPQFGEQSVARVVALQRGEETSNWRNRTFGNSLCIEFSDIFE